jgi:hypothetical protein
VRTLFAALRSSRSGCTNAAGVRILVTRNGERKEAHMRKSKRYPNVDELPLQLSDSISGYEKESKEAEAKLADARRTAKKKRLSHARTIPRMQ